MLETELYAERVEVRADNAYKGGGGETDIWEFHDMETAKLQPNNGLLDGKWFNVRRLMRPTSG